jgi:hypothetical protein
VEDNWFRSCHKLLTDVSESLERNGLLVEYLFMQTYEYVYKESSGKTDRTECIVCSDHPTVDFVLELVQLDVAPERLHEPSPGFLVCAENAR